MRCTLNAVLSASALTYTSSVLVLFLLLLPSSLPSASAASGTVIDLSPCEFRQGILNGTFDAVIDVRTPSEWSSGHIANTTFLDSLADFNTSSEKSTPDDLSGCENCRLALYCRSGNRSGRAARRLLEEAGFVGPIYNGGGVRQWTAAGFELVTGEVGDSSDPPCACWECGEEGQCRQGGEGGDVVDDMEEGCNVENNSTEEDAMTDPSLDEEPDETTNLRSASHRVRSRVDGKPLRSATAVAAILAWALGWLIDT